MTTDLTVIARVNPFQKAQIIESVNEGVTVSEILDLADISRNNVSICVFINDEPIDPVIWDYRRVYSGEAVYVQVVPMGGGGILRVVMFMAVMALAVWAAPLIGQAVGVALWTGGASVSFSMAAMAIATKLAFVGITAIGMLAVNAIAPPSTPELNRGGATAANSGSKSSPSLTGGSNQLKQYGPIPRPLGKHRIIPPLGAKSFTEISGDDQYLRMLFVVGYGPLELSDLKIGSTPIDDFDEIEYETRQGFDADAPLTLFTNSVNELPLGILLEEANSWSYRSTTIDTDEISLDITFPSGLIYYDINEDSQDKEALTVVVEWQFCPTGTGAWGALRTITTRAQRSDTFRIGDRITVGVQRSYDVRIRRVTADVDADHEGKQIDTVQWTALRSIESVYPINLTGLALIAVRIKASEAISGTVNALSLIAYSIADDWTDPVWTEQATQNPASLYRLVLQDRHANKRALSDAKIDLAALQEWHDFCVLNGFTYNSPGDFSGSIDQVISEIAAAGRAKKTYIDGKYSIIKDYKQSIPRQHFSPRNSWGYLGQKIFVTLPHAFRVLFADEDSDWQQNERIVYDDGYDVDNAAIFEQLPLPGITSSDLAWKHGRYHIACARLRPEIHAWYCDVEHLVCTRGDMIRFSHDVPLFGVSWGRVKALQDDGGGNTTGVTVDQNLAMEAAISYSIRFRKVDNTSVVCSLVNSGAGNYTTVTFTTPIAVADGPEVGDLGFFGVTGTETVELIVLDITPQEDLVAKIVAVDAAPAIYLSDTGTIPTFDSQITPPYDVPLIIGKPSITSIRSDESVLIQNDNGTLSPRVLVTFEWKSGELFDQIEYTEVWHRLSDSEGSWMQTTFAQYVAQLSILDVDSGSIYDFRFRYVLLGKQVSLWTEELDYLVIGKSTPPPDVITFYIENEYLKWTYPTKPRDFKGFRIRYRTGENRAWTDAISAHAGILTESQFPIAALPTGTLTIMIKAFDDSENPSTNQATIVKDLGDPLVNNVIYSYDHAANGYPQNITNGTVVVSDLKADSAGILFWNADDNSIFWDADNSSLFWDSLYLEMTYQFDFMPGASELPSQLTLDYDIVGSPWAISYRTLGDSIFWSDPDSTLFWDTDDTSLFWDAIGDYVPWPGFIDATLQTYQFEIVIGGGTVQGIIYDLSVDLDVDDIEEVINDQAIDAAGTAVNLANTYRVIQNVQLTLQDDGGDAVTAKIVSKAGTDTITIETLNAAEAGVTGTVDIRVQGY